MNTIKEMIEQYSWFRTESHTPKLKALYWTLQSQWFILVCKIRGHKLDCETIAGPNTGSDYMWCHRCGWSDEIIYY